MVFFIGTYLIFTEISSSAAPDIRSTMYKDGKKGLADSGAHDEEKGHVSGSNEKTGASKAIAEGAERMTDNFTWHNIRYTVPIAGGTTRQLLDDVSGYVVPGKLTALMGESGAGKVCL